MSTTSTSGVTGTGTPTQLDRTDSAGSLGQDAFLKLLVAQMQHQDPMAPTDSSQMMSQMAQFTSVEQLTNLAKDSQASNLTRPGQALGSLDYMAQEQIRGEEVSAATDIYVLGCRIH